MQLPQTTADRVAEILRARIIEGELRPGTQLSEERLVAQLAVSRNTLRESFRLLAHDGLLVHRFHRGVFVPSLSLDDVIDLYRVRRLIECGTVRSLRDLDANDVAAAVGEVDAAGTAMAAGDWPAVGTANMRFHQRLVGLARSPRVDEVMRRLLAELRLVFHMVASPRDLHERYVSRNHELLVLVTAGETAAAADELEQYLHESEQQLLSAYRPRVHEHDDVPVGSLG